MKMENSQRTNLAGNNRSTGGEEISEKAPPQEEKDFSNPEELKETIKAQTVHVTLLRNILRILKPERDMAKILDIFLGFLLGHLEIKRGAICLFDPKLNTSLIRFQGKGEKISSLWSEEELHSLKAYLTLSAKKADAEQYPVEEAQELPPVKPRELQPLFKEDPLCLWFGFAETQLGLVALWGDLGSRALAREHLELLKEETNILIPFLDRARALEKVRELTLELEQRMGQLKKISVDLKLSHQWGKSLEDTQPKIRQAIKREIEQTRRISIWDLLFILVLGAVLGFVFNLINPGGMSPIPQVWRQPSVPGIHASPAKEKRESEGAFLVDARPNTQFTQKHIRGAVNLPLSIFDFVYVMKFSRLDSEKPLIVYGRTISRQYDQEVAHLLREKGHRQVMVLSGGLSAWEEKGYPTEP